jgi:hypothetical protein
MPATTAASLLAIIGIFDLIGTIGSGYLTDKVSSMWLLVFFYGMRGLALLTIPVVLGPHVNPPLIFFIVFYGLDWIATVPPTVQLCREYFGVARSGVVYGWVFAFHMIGAAIAASFAGWIRETNGDYEVSARKFPEAQLEFDLVCHVPCPYRPSWFLLASIRHRHHALSKQLRMRCSPSIQSRLSSRLVLAEMPEALRNQFRDEQLIVQSHLSQVQTLLELTAIREHPLSNQHKQRY